MNPILFHIYGPLAIHMYGLCIALGGIISFYLFSHDRKIVPLISESVLVSIFQIILLAGFFGGRIGCILSQPEFFNDPFFLFKFWEPGLSVMGTIIGVAVVLGIYLFFKKISFLFLLDRISIYAPLAQSFGRLGCFFAGCCYGLPTESWFSVTYTHSNHLAPLHCSLHPAQLYSSIMLFFIFCGLYFILQYRIKTVGLLFSFYLFLVSLERFLLDFIRWDRIFIKDSAFFSFLSIHQWIALSTCFIAFLFVLVLSWKKR
ncbi:prolipoprotein diacylglyceryl transferase [Candidatus Dependentiae bacterium]|nr:prolipoprotein diacylglyceryl transferase [Candidatus Dependentiae bacterium]